jgi:hypothetical protein
MLERLTVLPEELPKPKKLTADAGYFSEANVNACEEAGHGKSVLTGFRYRPWSM